ncbi:MAG: glyoxalase superfamily protein [Pseudomonas sp.]
MQLAPAIPVLRIFCVEKAKEFYLDFLGFTLDWEHRFEPELPLYAQVHRDGLILHLSEHHGDATPGSTVFARVEDIVALQHELADKRYGYSRPEAISVGWGLQMEIADPFGNRLRFCQQIEG